jgi:hypothetical protein
MVELLLTLRANYTLATQDGYTCLHIAVDAGDPSIVNALLKREVDINARAKDGSTAYDIADPIGAERVKKQLEKRGAGKGTIRESQPPSGQRRVDTVDGGWNLRFEEDGVAMTLRKRLLGLVLDEQGSDQHGVNADQDSWTDLFCT